MLLLTASLRLAWGGKSRGWSQAVFMVAHSVGCARCGPENPPTLPTTSLLPWPGARFPKFPSLATKPKPANRRLLFTGSAKRYGQAPTSPVEQTIGSCDLATPAPVGHLAGRRAGRDANAAEDRVPEFPTLSFSGRRGPAGRSRRGSAERRRGTRGHSPGLGLRAGWTRDFAGVGAGGPLAPDGRSAGATETRLHHGPMVAHGVCDGLSASARYPAFGGHCRKDLSL